MVDDGKRESQLKYCTLLDMLADEKRCDKTVKHHLHLTECTKEKVMIMGLAARQTKRKKSQSENPSVDDGAVVNFEPDDSDSEHGDILIQIDPSDEDNREYISQARFRNESCGCKEFYGKPCSQVVSMDTVIEFREHCKELSRDELDLVMKSELCTHRRSGDLTTAKKHKQKDRERPFQEFYFVGHRVCRQTFCFAHGIEKKKLLAIAKSLDNDGLTPRVHSGKGRHVKHALGFTDTDRIKSFLQNMQ
ncbi:unnamed protein product [Mytilus coruscus]|uniref:Uncharacterized protein n=1 Tax=Mytilus coruscus TaxID=42192 RepID=A0A6J8BKP6_MYTCO|nr:unnamed protein product [Mytilus coruscus]